MGVLLYTAIALLSVSGLGAQDVNGAWNNWMEWSTCSVTCGLGYHVRSRVCDNPKPTGTGSNCNGLDYDTKHCNETDCPVDGEYGDWNAWTSCSSTCGTGIVFRVRQCDSPKPAFGGKPCNGSGQEFAKCDLTPCPIDGGLTNWGDYGACSQTCGYGVIRHRTRTCTNPTPQFGGADCNGKLTDLDTCDYHDCKDGIWDKWASWGECSATCGLSVHFRFRNCTFSANNGTCTGLEYQSGVCQSFCPVNGMWANWQEWSKCSTSCENGTMQRIRLCANPAPAHNGSDCVGGSNEIKGCTVPTMCPVDGNWGHWLPWTPCDVTCGGGHSVRVRQCNNPAPLYHGNKCAEKDIEGRECNNDHCPENGLWSSWFPWGQCSVTCGKGVVNRFRTCTNPKPQYGGDYCVGELEETNPCSISPDSTNCTIDGSWGGWGSWTACSATCGSGKRSRYRLCDSPYPHGLGKPCPGSAADETQCTVATPCPVNGGWSTWRDWYPCSATCGSGTETRFRTCTNPKPQDGGLYCQGEVSEGRPCSGDSSCPTDLVG